MNQINLLPWREQQRQTKKIIFLAIFAGFIALTLFFVFLLHLFFNSLIYSQKSSNEFLQSQYAKEQAALLIISKKKKEQSIIHSQMNFIFSLRNKSYRAVHLLDELVRLAPDSVFLTTLTREGNKIVLQGKAESNFQVTLFMENIARSSVFNQPVLTEISRKRSSEGEEKFFQLKVEQRE